MSIHIITYGGQPVTRVEGQNHFLSYNMDDWVPMTWQDNRIPTYGDNVWKRSDTGTIYYSQATGTPVNYVLSSVPSGGTTGSWADKTWSGLTSFDGKYVWNSANGKTYYSYSYVYPTYEPGNYVLGTSGSWSFIDCSTTTLIGDRIWNDGSTDYSDDEYYLLPNGYSWGIHTWIQPSGPEYDSGYHIWKDSLGHIYFSYGTAQCLIVPEEDTWYEKTWYGLTSFYGEDVWRDVKTGRIFYSNGTSQYILDEATYTWTPWIWKGLTDYYGRYVWTDGNRMFYSNGDNSQYVLNW